MLGTLMLAAMTISSSRVWTCNRNDTQVPEHWSKPHCNPLQTAALWAPLQRAPQVQMTLVWTRGAVALQLPNAAGPHMGPENSSS